MKRFALYIVAAIMLVASTEGRAPERTGTIPDPHSAPVRQPTPSTVDEVTHDRGNIVTTLENWGLIGGSSHLGKPSGEFPRNSGHNYLAEINYWMGAITAGGDTVIANTYDDFEAIADLNLSTNLNDPYRIMFSTDTTRYYNHFDISDTVGLGLGNPAYGWRVFNADSGFWIYSQNYSPSQAALVPGGPVSLQESHYRFGDHASGSPVLGLELTQTVLQWNYCYNEDFIFVILDIHNSSATSYPNFVFGLYVDLDVGGPDGSGENGRLQDTVVFDSSENLAYIYDAIGWDPGWQDNTGVMGTKYVETPLGIGMTGFNTGDWSNLPDDDPGRFALIDAAIYNQSLPPTDQYYIQCTRGINLMAGSTVRVVYALVAGENEEDFLANAELAQTLYDNYFVGPQPPPTPRVTARAGDRRVYLSWTDTSEVVTDPLSGENDFVGYKLYRSDNQGKTWGRADYNTGNNCLTLDYIPVKNFSVPAPGDPIPHTWVDTGLYNGVEYWYCLAAYDKGDPDVGIDALQSGFGTPDQSENVIRVTPRTDPAGHYEAGTTVEHLYLGVGEPSDAEVVPVVFDKSALRAQDYEIRFENDPQSRIWHLIDRESGDTLLADQHEANRDPATLETVDGLRLWISTGERNPQAIMQTALGGTDTNLVVAGFYGPAVEALTLDSSNAYGDMHFRATYELRYTGQSTVAPELRDYWNPGYFLPYQLPFEIWNTETNQRVSAAVYDFEINDVWDPYDLIAIVNYPYDSTQDLTGVAFPYYYSWMIGLDDAVYNPTVGDVLTIEGAPMAGPNDVFQFSIDGVDASAAHSDLSDIRVVPNPYFVQYSAMVETSEGQAVLEFQHLPDKCTVRIYTLAGDLVETIDHNDDSGTARWDLLSTSRRQVASGIYIYHVESPYGTHLGRFSVVK
jgi:hypothetical protein